MGGEGVESVMHKRTTPKIFSRATPPRRSVPGKNYTATCHQPRQNCGNIYALIEWAMSILEIAPPRWFGAGDMPLETTSLTSVPSQETDHRARW
jgi:hypothetical protein